MSKPLSHKGYAAHIQFDAEDRIFFGRVIGIADIVSFHGESVDELARAFEEAVDGYIAMSATMKRPAQKPASGKIMPRVPPGRHHRRRGIRQKPH